MLQVIGPPTRFTILTLRPFASMNFKFDSMNTSSLLRDVRDNEEPAAS